MSLSSLQNPLFIIGSPRSGTSLLRLIMTSHSKIIIPPECGFITWLHEKYNNWQVVDNTKSNILESFIDDLLESKKMDTWEITKADIKDKMIKYQPKDYAELCAVVYATYAASIEKDFQIWGDKNNFYLNHLDELLDLYNDARFLHIVRDGRDVACSYREVMDAKSDSLYTPNLETKIHDIALSWQDNTLKIDSFVSAQSAKAAMTTRYEDLVTAPSTIVKSICEWLDIPFESDMLNFYQQNKSKKLEPDLTIDWKKRTLQPISADTVGRYVNILNKSEQDEFQALASNALKRFSYKVS